MIRWREQQNLYRLDISFGAIDRLPQLGILAAILVGGILFSRLSRTTPSSPTVELVIGGIMAVGFLLVFGINLLRDWESFRRTRAWVEISTDGACARWGGPEVDGPVEFIEVIRFELVYGGEGSGGVNVALPDGRRLPVFGPWDPLHLAKAEKLVQQLNACLRTIEASASTLDVVPGGMQVESLVAPVAIEDPWVGHVPPYCVRFRSMDSAAIGASIPVLVAIVVWLKFRPDIFDSAWAPAALAANAVALVAWYWTDVFWIEVTRRGGPVRWGRRGEEWTRLPTVVEKFVIGHDIDANDKKNPRYFPVAILPGGAQTRPLRHYRTRFRFTVEAGVRSLNRALQTDRKDM